MLPFEEIGRIKNLTSLLSTLENTRGWMLIGLIISQRISDLLKLTPQNIPKAEIGIYVDLLQQKTEKRVTIWIVDAKVTKNSKRLLPIFNQHSAI